MIPAKNVIIKVLCVMKIFFFQECQGCSCDMSSSKPFFVFIDQMADIRQF